MDATTTSGTGGADAEPVEAPPRVFISYSHDSSLHCAGVLKLAQQLRKCGFDAWLDQFEDPPAEGWPEWVREQLMGACFVLVICTRRYRQRFECYDPSRSGTGSTWEGFLTPRLLHEDAARNLRFIPVFIDEPNPEHVPLLLSATPSYSLPRDLAKLQLRMKMQRAALPVKSSPWPALADWQRDDLAAESDVPPDSVSDVNPPSSLPLNAAWQFAKSQNPSVGSPGWRAMDGRHAALLGVPVACLSAIAAALWMPINPPLADDARTAGTTIAAGRPRAEKSLQRTPTVPSRGMVTLVAGQNIDRDVTIQYDGIVMLEPCEAGEACVDWHDFPFAVPTRETHRFTVSRPGYEPYQHSVYLRPEDAENEVRLLIDLQPEKSMGQPKPPQRKPQ